MFSIRQIRANARQLIAETPGAYLLALIPVILGVIIQLVYSSQSDDLALQLANSSIGTSQLINLIAFPLVYNILVDLMTLSMSLALFQVIYHYRDSVSFKDSFTLFNHRCFGRILATYLLKNLFLFLWGLFIIVGLSFMLAGIYMAELAMNVHQNSEGLLVGAGMMIIVGFIIMIAGIPLLLTQALAYFLVEPLLFDKLAQDTYTGPLAVIKESRRLMKGYKTKAFILNLSFIGWFFLSYISIGIVGIYVIPYYLASHIYFYQAVLEDRSMKEKLFQGMML
ncbi:MULTISPECIES: DUF975 family protein [unclassified Streptococcus]|uniref:DUF975 family protein n=1 Tax=unclassified Streptococcus TaxID=2608887 RepID=UPI00107261B7|nr:MULTISPECIES: DUF975 family protein [unclassified Streptococcus]MBF0786787.1 DUF975 family protein [Streptococcus sp. 19428wC2_LYSM12]MCQ9211026.1 DUF975 family protein [Streptococcus sp. B01]MCQ9214301.1 DUF975 family protein [Streptococcus sp. O1]TFV06329.1 DUF975 family protein [Streptococcus sp. LYSM12]